MKNAPIGKPTEPGWYWYKLNDSESPIYLTHGRSGLEDSTSGRSVTEMPGEFAGPLKDEPEET